MSMLPMVRADLRADSFVHALVDIVGFRMHFHSDEFSKLHSSSDEFGYYSFSSVNPLYVLVHQIYRFPF